MRNNAGQTKSDSPKRGSWRKVAGAVTVIILLVGIAAALSKQSGQTVKAQVEQEQKAQPQKAQVEERKPEIAKHVSKNYVTSNAAGQTVVIDRQTGQTRPLTQEEARRLAEGIRKLVNQSDDGLVEVKHEDGSVSMDLQGRFQNVMLAKKDADGKVSQSCVNDLEAAAEFFEIDPALLGIAAPISKRQSDTSKLPIR